MRARPRCSPPSISTCPPTSARCVALLPEHRVHRHPVLKRFLQIDFGRELFGKHNVATQTYARVNKIYGDRDLTDLVAVLSQHASEATLLAAFDQHLPADQRALCCASTGTPGSPSSRP